MLLKEVLTHACYCVTRHNASLERILTPEPKGAEVLIRMTGTGVCHSGIYICEGVTTWFQATS